MNIRLILIFSFLILAEAHASETIAQICGLHQPARTFSSAGEARGAICDVLNTSLSPETQKLAGESFAILTKLQSEGESFQSGEYFQSLDRLAQTVNSSLVTPQADAGLGGFIAKYQSPMRRKNQSAYLEDIKAIMATSAIGRQALDCFSQNSAPFKSSEVRFATPEQMNILGTFSVEKTEDGSFKKVLQFNLESSSPDRALSLVAHEMMHACDAGNFAHQENEFEASQLALEQRANEKTEAVAKILASISANPNLSKKEKARRSELVENYEFNITTKEELEGVIPAEDVAVLDHVIAKMREAARSADQVRRIADQNNAISELKVYKLVNVDFFKELAKQSPAYFCNSLTPSAFQGGIVSTGESRAFLEDSINNQTFINTLIAQYAKSGMFDPYSFYEPKYDESGSSVMEFSLEEIMKRKPDARFEKAIRETYGMFSK
ncbi:MAG: hypothetical protein K2P81_00645 [Bacteriovoracaceae bacterium]|nr:hypothetical protein [Bacteriovoracaceae bacterium]